MVKNLYDLWPMNTQTFLYLMTFSMQARWRKNELTTGALGGTSGALQRKLSKDRTLWKVWKDESCCVRNVIRWHSSVRMTKSRMMGLANSESWIMRGKKRKSLRQCHWDTSTWKPMSNNFLKAPIYTTFRKIGCPTGFLHHGGLNWPHIFKL